MATLKVTTGPSVTYYVISIMFGPDCKKSILLEDAILNDFNSHNDGSIYIGDDNTDSNHEKTEQFDVSVRAMAKLIPHTGEFGLYLF